MNQILAHFLLDSDLSVHTYNIVRRMNTEGTSTRPCERGKGSIVFQRRR